MAPCDPQLLSEYRVRVENILQQAMQQWPSSDLLTQACQYAVSSPGKRLRPILLLAIAEALGATWSVEPAATAVEMFHCASLIADDLPCMDDDDLRRGRASVHKKFDEATAILATYGLISEGYSAVYANAMQLASNGVADAALRGLIAVKCIADNAGLQGAAGGQYIDLKVTHPSLAQLEEILQKKTATIFEISCVLGWVFAGGALERLEEVKKLSFNLGMAFQIIDDIEDLSQASERVIINYAATLGTLKAKAKALEHLQQAQALFKALKLETPILELFVQMLMAKAT